jgi:septal ring factor EnvC (AmiA/AmiB activator)
MDSAKIREHLAKAEEKIKEAKARITDQERRVEQLSADGHDTGEAERMLTNLRKMLQAMAQHRNIILAELERNTA